MKKIILFFISIFSFLNSFAQNGWQSVDSGVRGISAGVYSMCVDTVNNFLYVGGSFDSAGSVSAQNIAKWDGSKWNALGSGYGGQVSSMVMYHGNLYVASSSSNYIWYWNGSSWKYILQPFNGGVNVLYVYNDTLYAGGSFTKSGSTILNYIAKWDSANWKPLGNGINGSANPQVMSMMKYNGNLYIGGLFETAGGDTAYNIAEWSNNKWLSIGAVTSSSGAFGAWVQGMQVYQSSLYIGGTFDSVNHKVTPGFAKWNDTLWETYGSGYFGPVEFTIYNNDLFAGGNFGGSIYGNYISKFNDSTWSPVDSGTGNPVYALATYQGKLYVGGLFDTAGQISANYIASWSPDTTTSINQLVIKNNRIVVYPNPASNHLTIVNKQLLIKQIQIKNVLGETLIEQICSSDLQRQTIDVNKLPQGIYFYIITNSNSQVFTGKFVKE